MTASPECSRPYIRAIHAGRQFHHAHLCWHRTGAGNLQTVGRTDGGSTGVESTEGEGSSFWFTVVMEKQDEAGADQRSCPVSEEQKVSPLPNKSSDDGIRILLTEDDPRAQKIVPKLLKNYGYLVDVAGDGKETLEALQSK